MNIENNFPLLTQNDKKKLDLEMVPLNILTRDQFIDMIKNIFGNKIQMIQIRQINQACEELKIIDK
jgi:hypothetical protein